LFFFLTGSLSFFVYGSLKFPNIPNYRLSVFDSAGVFFVAFLFLVLPGFPFAPLAKLTFLFVGCVLLPFSLLFPFS